MTAIGQHERAQSHLGLGARPHVGDRVLPPRSRVVRVDPAAPQVDHHLAVVNDGDRGADIGTRIDVGGQDVAQRGKALIAGTVNLSHVLPLC
ncbi:MAG: hypothetical protein RIS33_433 [Actinomycetota bacterium]